VLAQVDALDCHIGCCHQRIDKLGPESGHGDHDTVVVRVRIRIQQMRMTGCIGDCLEHVLPAAFGKVWNRFEKTFVIHLKR
jgi:hypothetical protein